jgi:uncharacterized protein YwqG
MTSYFPVTRAEICQFLEKFDLGPELALQIAALAKPAIALTTEAKPENEILLGASRFGGRPDLPAGLEWPMRPAFTDAAGLSKWHSSKIEHFLADMASGRERWYTDAEGQAFIREHEAMAAVVAKPFPLSFYCQLDLATLAGEDGFDPAFPTSGRLLAFFDRFTEPGSYHPEIGKAGRLLWDETPVEGLRRAQLPAEFVRAQSDFPHVFATSTVTAETMMSPVDLGSVEAGALMLDDAQRDSYVEALSAMGCFYPQGGDHRLGGWPASIQSGMQREAQLTSNGIWCGTREDYNSDAARALLLGASDWRLVLQIDSDPDMLEGGTGCVYVLMRKQDLAARAFDRAVTIYQFS